MFHERQLCKTFINTESADTFLCLPCPYLSGVRQTRIVFLTSAQLEGECPEVLGTGTQPFTQTLITSYLKTKKANLRNFRPLWELKAVEHLGLAKLSSLFPDSPLAHIYLGLCLTLLRDLFVVAGDTWIFSRELTPQSAFNTAQPRLRA